MLILKMISGESLWQLRMSKIKHLEEAHPGKTVKSALVCSRANDKEFRKKRYRDGARKRDGRRAVKDEAVRRQMMVSKPLGHEIGILELESKQAGKEEGNFASTVGSRLST